MTSVCLQVCVLCGEGESADPAAVAPGRRLYEALLAASADSPEINVQALDCLAVCDRPVTLVFRAVEAERWSYLIGGADPAEVNDILAAARAVAASPHGVPAMDDRPPFFRRGVIGRLPPQPGRRGEDR